jgi:hypothetical protein
VTIQPPRRPGGLPANQVWIWPPPAAFGNWARPTGPVRIGDTERDTAVAALGDHFAAGRLTREEFDERIDQAMQARFESDLQPLFADLPGAGAERQPATGWPVGVAPRVPVFLWFLPVILVALIVTAIALSAPWMLWGVFWLFILSRFWMRRPPRPGPWRR